MSTSEKRRAVSSEDVRRISELARLRPSDEALEQLTEELNGILEHVRVLETVDLSPIAGEEAISPDSGSFRDPGLIPDELEASAPSSIAPDWTNGFFVVPRLPALDRGSPHEGGTE